MKKIALGICAHVDAGKTTLTEGLLYTSGTTRHLGRVDHGDTFLDTDPMEKDRGITIYSKEARIVSDGCLLQILDTPGHVDFSADMERSMTVMDCAVLVVSGPSGVQSHTRTLWNLLAHYRIPTFLFVNKMDQAGADRDAVLLELKSELSGDIVDFSSENAPDPEALSLTDEAMLEAYLENGAIPDDLVADAIASRHLFPVWFGSALKMDGVEELLHGLVTYAKEPEHFHAFGALVYKIGHDTGGARLTFLKMTGGDLHVKDAPLCGEKVDQIRLISGGKFTTVDSVSAGDLCAVTGLSSTRPGQGLGVEPQAGAPLLEPVETHTLLLPDAVSPLDFFRKMKDLSEEIPEIRVLWNGESREIRIRSMGQVHLEILKTIIRDRYGVDIAFGPGSILYKETLAESVEGVGHYEPLRHYAEVHLLLEPAPRGSGITVRSALSLDVLDAPCQSEILSVLRGEELRGVLTGSPLTDVTITLVNGRASVKHTEGGDMREATLRAVRQGLRSAHCLLLEPFDDCLLTIPSENVGRAMTDFSAKGGTLSSPRFFDRGSTQMATMEGSAPAALLFGYSEEVTAYTRGEGSCALSFHGYDLCMNPEEVIMARAYDSEADEAHPTGSVFCAHGAGFFVPWNEVPDYMHLPFLSSASGGAEEASEEAAKGRKKKDIVPGSEEDKEFWAVYNREFGKSARDNPETTRRKWDSSSGRAAAAGRTKVDKHGAPIYPKKDTRESYLIVDGYNVIFSWDDLSSLKDVSIDAARGRLLDILSNYQGYTGLKITVVFDAYKTDRTPESYGSYDNLEVVFTQKDETADAFIEKTVHDLKDQYKITVATSDGLEQLTVMRLGALRMSSRMLREEVDRVTKSK